VSRPADKPRERPLFSRRARIWLTVASGVVALLAAVAGYQVGGAEFAVFIGVVTALEAMLLWTGMDLAHRWWTRRRSRRRLRREHQRRQQMSSGLPSTWDVPDYPPDDLTSRDF
jgi:hypothetical protein